MDVTTTAPLACQLKGLFFAIASVTPMIMFILNTKEVRSRDQLKTRDSNLIIVKFPIINRDEEKLTLNNPNVFPAWNFKQFTDIPPLVMGPYRASFGAWPWVCERSINVPEGTFMPRLSATCGIGCRQNKTKRRTFIFFGDSHVMHLAEGVNYLASRFTEYCFIMVGKPSGYAGLVGKLGATTNANFKNIARSANVYGEALRHVLPHFNPNLTHIFLGARWDWYLEEFIFLPEERELGSLKPFHGSANASVTEKLPYFEKGIIDTFNYLRDRRFTVTFLGQAPGLNVSAVRVGLTCTKTIKGVAKPARYTEPLKDKKSAQSRKLFLRLTQKLGTSGFNFIDPLPLFCDTETRRCAQKFKHMCAYWDDTHLSPMGSMLYGKLIELFIRTRF